MYPADTAAVLLAAGSSRRMGMDKLQLCFGGKTPIEHSFAALAAAGVNRICIAVSDATKAQADEIAKAANIPVTVVKGGSTRGESVYNALRALNGADIVVIHDAARCLVTPALIRESIISAMRFGSGIAALPARDTVWRRGDSVPLKREELLLAQTPQTFCYGLIMQAYHNAFNSKALGEATDDCVLFIQNGNTPHFIEGNIMNQKFTRPEDMPLFAAQLGAYRTGMGEDTHRLITGRRLVLGGVDIPFEMGLLGHSDADALAHAIADALLGAAALGDIGGHFPDTDPKYKDADSLKLLETTAMRVREKGYEIINIDATITAQKPKLMPYIPGMRLKLAEALGMDISAVSVKATTPEGLGPEGNMECITVRAVCTVRG